MIKENLETVQKNIDLACEKKQRQKNSVTLIAVSKTKPISLIREAYDCGVRDFGENKAQELKEKAQALPKDIRWHFIGHLQTNKVKYVVGTACLIHSVDTLHLAQAIDRQSEKIGVTSDILLEVNVAGEESKFGGGEAETFSLVKEVAKLPHLQIKGLMTVAPNVTDPEQNRKIFSRLNKLSVDISNENIDNVDMSVLSMGMTNDYETAVEEGATFVRVGTGIFGSRNA